MTNDEKLHLLVQRVADLQAQYAALEYFTSILVPLLLNVLPEEKALEMLALARRDITVVTRVEDGGDDKGDMLVMERKIRDAIHKLINQAELRCNAKGGNIVAVSDPRLRH